MAQADEKKQTKSMLAWALYDWGHNAFGTVILTFIFSAYFIRYIAENETTGTTAWGYGVGIAGIFIAILAPILGAIGDQKGNLKPWILTFTLLCALATGGLWFITPDPDSLVPALFLVGIGIIGAQLAFVFYNTLLTHLVDPRERRKWSGWGWGLGYVGGLVCLISIWFGLLGNDPFFPLDEARGLPVRAACVFTAVWLVVFTLPLLFWAQDAEPTQKSLRTAARDGWNQLRESLKNIRRYKPIVRFLIAHMLYIDALIAVFTMGGIFAAGTIGMDTREVLLFGITINITAGFGAIAFAWFDYHFGSKPTILIGLGGLILSACVMLLMAEDMLLFWIFGAIFGIFVGPTQAASRSYLAQTAPKELRTQMFGLYALSGKATTFIGPLLVGLVTALFDSPRAGMSVLLLLFLAGFSLLLTVPRAKELNME